MLIIMRARMGCPKSYSKIMRRFLCELRRADSCRVHGERGSAVLAKADEGALSAPHFGHRRTRGLPRAVENFRSVVLSVPFNATHRLDTRQQRLAPLVSPTSASAYRRSGAPRKEGS